MQDLLLLFEASPIIEPAGCEITGQKRGRAYRFDRYIDTLDDGWSWSERKTALDGNPKGAVAAPADFSAVMLALRAAAGLFGRRRYSLR